MPKPNADSRNRRRDAKRVVKIGGACGYWGDSILGATQLVRRGDVDYVVFDFLAEVTMSLLARLRLKDPGAGFATDFVDSVMANIGGDVVARGIRILSNAGGINPAACAAALRRILAAKGLHPKIAVVEGDDYLPMLTGNSSSALDRKYLSANAYLGAVPVVQALDDGAQIVITGRCADSALALGALMHEFGWSSTDYDRLAAGTVAGHLLECGPQVTGGMHTDWYDVGGWDDIGYPLAECRSDGSFVLTKHPGTGGLVSPATVAEQLLYEVGDPSAYVMPDVVCDLTQVTLEPDGADRVRVTGARGGPPTDRYKVALTYLDGWRSVGRMISVGTRADEKARRAADMIVQRTRTMFRDQNLEDYSRVGVEIIGAETLYGPHARVPLSREVTMRLTVEHRQKEALDIFAREVAPSSVSTGPAILSGGDAGRPKVTSVVRLETRLVSKLDFDVYVDLDGARKKVGIPPGIEQPDAAPASPRYPAAPTFSGRRVTMPLVSLAYARSGDKGNTANIAIIARHSALSGFLAGELTTEVVANYLAHLVEGPVTRFEIPGLSAFNFLLENALGGGGMSSIRYDPLGKAMAQILLDLELDVPIALLGYCRVFPEATEKTIGDARASIGLDG